ncbi:DUF4426 domain-containing protein [Stutzerimonas tarimensis]|uniref:DUF4426 domain-containing protein n=1 Tax=Stutzerimonas tarimensis TaxID=1507735 RepID=A0ABV7T532_9GAMM
MKSALIALFALFMALPAFAERKQTFGDYDIHYIAFHSSFLTPEIASAAGLVRSRTQGVLNVAVQESGKPVTAQVSGTMTNLLGQQRNLNFRQVREDEAVYYLTQFPIDTQELLRFQLNVHPSGGRPINIQFEQEVFPE